MKKLSLILLALMAFGPMVWAQTVSNATELNDAIANNANITLANDITLTAHLTIPNNAAVTIDLGGNTLSRNLSSATSEGCVIIVAQTGNLTLTNGTISGGWNSTDDAIHSAGGIVNKGTTTLNKVTISGCKGTDGGGIMNRGTLTLTSSSISGNESTHHGGGGITNYGTVNMEGGTITGNICHTVGGGIWSNGTLNMLGNVTVTGNTNHGELTGNVYLTTGHVINVTGSLGTSTIGIGIQGHSGMVTSGLSGNGDLSNFSNDYSDITDLSLNGSEATLTAKSGVYYVKRDWDGSKVTETLRRMTSGYTELTNTSNDDSSENRLTLESGGWYVIKNNNVKYYRIIVDADEWNHANLILCDGAKLESPIIINSDNGLNIFGQISGTGKIVANGVEGSAGIGSEGEDKDMGTLVIHGGTITAIGAQNGLAGAAGIGGGSFKSIVNSAVCNGGDVTIYGGTIEAYGNFGAGIGGGSTIVNDKEYGGSGGSLTVYGGNIYASGYGGAGIGGGKSPDSEMENRGSGGNVTIWGGRVEAHGHSLSAGIGGGHNGNGGNVTIHGGSVYAYGDEDAAGIGSGEQKKKPRHGGRLTVNGGFVEAHGGNHGAGIGGGQDASGATVEINGGEVRAFGGTDAAGIGSGEEFVSGPINGGSLTVNGGKVFADGSGWGAGIGGGEDANGATVVINGGEVTAWAGADAGNKNGCAIGSEDGDGHRGSLQIGDAMMVHAGQNPENTSPFPFNTRVPACYYRPYARIEPCNHDGATYTINGTGYDDTHTLHCKHCKANTTEPHIFNNNQCTVCHVETETRTVTIYLPVIDANGSYEDGNYGTVPAYTYYMPKNSQYVLPAAPVENEPLGMEFAGWKNGDPSSIPEPHTFVAGTNEELIPVDDNTYTLSENLTLTARYNKINLFNTDGNWNDYTKWYWQQVPNNGSNVVIGAVATIPAGYIARAGEISIREGSSLTIKDGGQLINEIGVWATVEKDIAGHNGPDDEGGWHFISQPTMNYFKPSADNGFLTEDPTKYDLYYYHEPTHYWRNYKPNVGNADTCFYIETEKGYLYANEEGTTLKMTGTIWPADLAVTFDNLSLSGGDLAGFNLVGNPFACNATINRPAYVINGRNVVAYTGGKVIAPCEGVMVQAKTGQTSVTFTPLSSPIEGELLGGHSSLQVVLSQQNANTRGMEQIDNVIVSFKEGEQLEKFLFNADLAKLYIPKDQKDYAITYSEKQGEMPLNFKATQDGEYTIAVNPENMEMGYLHLVDNLTGADVDLLASPSYTFQAKTTDYESRFKLVFAVGSSTDSDTFAFISNGNIIVNGEGTLQMMDVTGRVDWVGDAINRVSTSGMPAGVYVLRLINGNDVKTQKIIIQ